MTDRRRAGRRPGTSGTRQLILAAARRSFMERGFDRTGIRHVALTAGVDPALVHHFFGTKQELFAAAVELPADPASVVPMVLAGPRGQIGRRLAGWFVTMIERDDARDRLVAMVRSAMSNEQAAAMWREFFEAAVVGPLATGLGQPDARLRATLAQSQLMGLFIARHVMQIEPLHSTPPDELVTALAPTLQRYLTGRL